MSTLKRLIIQGLWGAKDLDLTLHDDINFLIGTNGSGKTTVINLIAAALSADFQTLDRIDFKKIEIHLANPKGSTVQVVKKTEKQSPFMGITYRYKPGKTEDWKEYSLDNIEGQLSFRDWTRHIHRRPDPIAGLGIEINLTWLSIHRVPPGRPKEDRSFESTIDIKLDQLSNALTRLFSQFKNRGDEETAKFQSSLFLALLPPEQWTLVASVKALDLEKEQRALREIFEHFRLAPGTYTWALEQQFERVNGAVTKDSFTEREIIALSAMWSIHKVVQEWGDLRAKQNEIYRPRDNFLAIINEMLRRKKLTINERNELKAEMAGATTIGLTELSSGEKQLVIILGEALLQQREPWIYIADEPELSLHVTWQEKLTSNLRQINPSAQIIFATHSPDIVGRFEDKIFDMEKLLA